MPSACRFTWALVGPWMWSVDRRSGLPIRQALGTEFLYRLLMEPRRWRRYGIVPEFACRVLLEWPCRAPNRKASLCHSVGGTEGTSDMNPGTSVPKCDETGPENPACHGVLECLRSGSTPWGMSPVMRIYQRYASYFTWWLENLGWRETLQQIAGDGFRRRSAGGAARALRWSARRTPG